MQRNARFRKLPICDYDEFILRSRIEGEQLSRNFGLRSHQSENVRETKFDDTSCVIILSYDRLRGS